LKDMILVAAVVLAFAFLVTAHVAIAVGLLGRAPRWRAPVALAVPPLAPYWAWRERMRVRAGLWAAGLVVYVAARIVASF
jgi:hypothetical protein